MEFDIVIPVGPKDVDVLEKQLDYTKKNIVGYRTIYLIHETLEMPGCITIKESAFPFSLKTVATYHGCRDRNGWYLQQLLKLYAGLIIPDILERYLVVDADTFFLKPTTFYKDGLPLYNFGREWHTPYFDHMMRLHPDFVKVNKTISGICHHMMFETRYIKELFHIVESKHNEPFYETFLKKVVLYDTSGASEYELYFNFMLLKHPRDISIRALNWTNTSTFDAIDGYDYISYHWHIR
jgi:hypothetical protein